MRASIIQRHLLESMESSSTNTSANPEVSDKSNRYDRQLRLWGDHGQICLETAKICLLNATATGTEILKNLVLPGIGSFTIVDGNKVTGADVGNNFFLTKDSIGMPRAQVTTDLLMELNEEVSGDFVGEPPEKLLENNQEFFSRFNLVIATDLQEKPLLQLASLLRASEIPLLIARSYGFIGYARLVISDHTVIESHPDNTHEDLRLDRPFPGLIEFCDGQNMDEMSKKEYSHTPWLVIIYKYLQKWKEEHDGEMPKTYKEKCLLKEMITNEMLKNESGATEEDNFKEAIRNVNTSLVKTSIPSEVKKLFEDPTLKDINADSKPFWIMLQAIKEFTENEGNGALPLRGTIPDMTADSNRYVQLQNVYRDQASKDADIVLRRVQDLLQRIGKPYCSITEQDVKLFCRNGSFLRVIHCRSLSEEYDPKTAKVQELAMQLGDEEDSDIVFYIMLRSVDRFFEEYSRFPGWYNDQVEGDVFKLKAHVGKILQELGLTSTLIKDDYVHEMCRYGASELHSIAAFMGGMLAQEAIKIITSQFVPFNNTLIYNGMKQSTITLEL